MENIRKDDCLISISISKAKKKVNCFSGPPSSVLNAPLRSFFSDLNKRKHPHPFFLDVKIKISTFLCLNEQKRCLITSLGFDKVKNKKCCLICFFGKKQTKKNLPASSVFQKSGMRNTCLYFFGLINAHKTLFLWQIDKNHQLIS